MKKKIDVFTNDPSNARITLGIGGTVRNFARLTPRYARLVGTVGTEIKKEITITREKDFPFKILGVTAKNGRDIVFDFKEFSKEEDNGYVLTIENKKTAAGRYADTVILTTDSTIKPKITVPVYGQITSATPPTENNAQKKSPGEG